MAAKRTRFLISPSFGIGTDGKVETLVGLGTGCVGRIAAIGPISRTGPVESVVDSYTSQAVRQANTFSLRYRWQLTGRAEAISVAQLSVC